jgi:hypothetical protein
MLCHAKYRQEMFFQLIKKGETVVGCLIASHKNASAEVRSFCCNLMKLLNQNSIRMIVFPQGKSILIYNPLRTGEARKISERLIKFSIGEGREAKELKEILLNPDIRPNVKIIGHDDIYGLQLTVEL